jgi:hypothetical protein
VSNLTEEMHGRMAGQLMPRMRASKASSVIPAGRRFREHRTIC